MEEFLKEYGAVILGIIFGLFADNIYNFIRTSSPWKKFKHHFSTSEQYWRITTFFSIITVSSALAIIFYSPEGTVMNNLSFLVQLATLVFGLYVGYFAFKQMNLGRYESIVSSAKQLFVNGGDFKRAIKEYELASSIKLTFGTGAEQTECYVCLSEWAKYDRMMDRLPHVKVDHRDDLILFYLKALEPLFKEELGRLKEVFRQTVTFKKSIKKSIAAGWSSAEIKKSEVYENLSNEIKTLVEPFFKYINNQLSESEKQTFEETYS